jgi:hypothetical protein
MRIIAYALQIFSVAAALAAEPPEKPTRKDEPIANKMKKPGMKQGDVKKEAREKAREMKPMLEKEEKEMAPPAPPKR